MKKYIETINKAFKQELISNKPKDGLEKLFYSVNTNSFFSLANKRQMQSLFQMKFVHRFIFKKKRQVFTH